MVRVNRSACALFASVSLSALMMVAVHSTAPAQTATQAQQQPLAPVQVEAPTQRKRIVRNPKPQPVRGVRAARSKPVVPVTTPAPSQSEEPVTSVASKTSEPVINTLAPVSVLRPEQIQRTQAMRLSDLLIGLPGVSMPERGDDPGSSINIRGLQDFGRVATLVDGVPQNFQRWAISPTGNSISIRNWWAASI